MIANRAAAVTQYQSSCRWWESVTAAGNMLEAITYLLQEDAQSFSIGSMSVSRQNMEELEKKVSDFVFKNVAPVSRTNAPLFARGRVSGMGKW